MWGPLYIWDLSSPHPFRVGLSCTRSPSRLWLCILFLFFPYYYYYFLFILLLSILSSRKQQINFMKFGQVRIKFIALFAHLVIWNQSDFLEICPCNLVCFNSYTIRVDIRKEGSQNLCLLIFFPYIFIRNFFCFAGFLGVVLLLVLGVFSFFIFLSYKYYF